MYVVPTPQVRNKVVGLGRGGGTFYKVEGKYIFGSKAFTWFACLQPLLLNFLHEEPDQVGG